MKLIQVRTEFCGKSVADIHLQGPRPINRSVNKKNNKVISLSAYHKDIKLNKDAVSQ
jgi:hypothetical protein